MKTSGLARVELAKKKSERGFTLVELGIVVAVIAILATLILMGKGFMNSARSAKATEAIDTISKAVQTYSGTLGGQLLDDGTLLTSLNSRNLVAGPDGWTPVANFVSFKARTGGGTTWQLEITCPTGSVPAQLCYDLWQARFTNDNGSMIKVATTIKGTACDVTLPTTSNSVKICFNL